MRSDIVQCTAPHKRRAESNLQATLQGDTITIEGNIALAEEREVFIRVFDPENRLKIIDQISSDTNGDLH